jgi:hypothetical protein
MPAKTDAARKPLTAAEQKDALKAALRNMRYAGLMAHGNYSCCQGCGGAELAERRRCGEKARGYAFWHKQDERWRRKGEDFHIAYGAFDGEPVTDHEVGEIVLRCLSEAGVAAEWNGDPAVRITVRGAASP